MRTLILADIHANIDALEAVLSAASALHIDRAIVLGDLVGYNAAPVEVLRRLDELAPVLTIRGNHDKVCAGLEPAVSFHPIARAAVDWTREQLPDDLLETLAALPRGPKPLDDLVEACHGAPFDEDYYVMDAFDAWRALTAVSASVCLNAHTHVPAVFRADGWAVRDEVPVGDPGVVSWAAGGKVLVNVGSVGQPRDGDPRAAYGILDEGAGTIELRRVEYDVTAAQQRIVQAGLPPFLAERLAQGV